jgi:hypothetical protein
MRSARLINNQTGNCPKGIARPEAERRVRATHGSSTRVARIFDKQSNRKSEILQWFHFFALRIRALEGARTRKVDGIEKSRSCGEPAARISPNKLLDA